MGIFEKFQVEYVFIDIIVYIKKVFLLRIRSLRVSTFYIGLTLMEIRKLAQVYAVKTEHNIHMC